jgi:hypothetical protein
MKTLKEKLSSLSGALKVTDKGLYAKPNDTATLSEAIALLKAESVAFGQVSPRKDGWLLPINFPREFQEVADLQIRETSNFEGPGQMDFCEFMDIFFGEEFRKSVKWAYDSQNLPQCYIGGKRVSPKELGWKSSNQDYMIPTHFRTLSYRAVKAIWATGKVTLADVSEDGAKKIDGLAQAKASERKATAKAKK